MKNHTQNAMENLFSDPFLKSQNWAYVWINSLKCYTVCFYCMPSWVLWKYIETKLLTICFYAISSSLKKQKGVCLTASFTAWFLKKNILSGTCVVKQTRSKISEIKNDRSNQREYFQYHIMRENNSISLSWTVIYR